MSRCAAVFSAALGIGAAALDRELGQRQRREADQDRHRRELGRDEHARGREQRGRAPPQSHDRGRATGESRHDACRRDDRGQHDTDDDGRNRVEQRADRRAMDEILLQQVVGGRRLDFDADELCVERRRHDFAGSESGRADEHDLAAHGVGGQLAGEDVGRGEIRERPLLAAEAEQQVAAAVERHVAIADRQDGRVGVRDAKHHSSGRACGDHGGEREAGIHAALELRQQGHAAQDPVAIRRGVHESGPARGFREDRQVAHGRRGLEHRRRDRRIGRLDDRERRGMQHARTLRRRGRVELQAVSEYDRRPAQRARERFVRRLTFRSRARRDMAIGFGEHDIDRDDGCTRVAQARDQLSDDVAPPRPLADRFQAALIHVHDDDGRIGLLRLRHPDDHVVRRIVQPRERGGAQQRENRDEHHRQEAAGENEATPGSA